MKPTQIATALLLSAMLVFPGFAYGKPKHGGQVVAVQGHQFELVVEPEAKGTHLDLFISDPSDKPVTTATVKMQVIGPDGQRTVLPLKYGGGHYTVVLPGAAKGEYKVVTLATVSGKKLNSRFNFNL
ncbi:MAG: hypothetical protein H7Y22_19765 [Gemmatimonadaceae bacterium]|nr:hypothetical protein [Gloeobacterales cyanobacterium ES-bin-141]